MLSAALASSAGYSSHMLFFPRVLDFLVPLSSQHHLSALQAPRGLQSCRNWKQESVCSCSSSALLLGEIALCHSTLLPELQWSGCRGVLGVRGARPEKCFIVQTQGQAMGNRLLDRHHGLYKCYFHLT